MIPYLVCGFEKHTLSNLVKECFGDEFPDILKKSQIHYIYRYLKDLGAKSILLEFDYVDKDYLEDYSRYYVKRFSGAGHKCARLHFFSSEVDHTRLNKILVDENLKVLTTDLQSAYLGFMVIKPLPKTFIGKTCLKSYPDRSDAGPFERKLLKRTYTANLFGIDLTVESIAFQEQDKVVSACATASIWAALNTIEWRHIREIPACSIITTNAINFIEGTSNGFPNKELSNKQILRALDMENLRHHSEALRKSTRGSFIESVRLNIDSGLPLILGGNVYTINSTKTAKVLSKKAGHAVTVLGYRFSAVDPTIYLHDDRLGPYARATFVALSEYTFNDESDASQNIGTDAWGLTLQQKNDEGKWDPAHEILIPDSSIVPTHQKVRLPSKFARNTFEHITSEYNQWLSSIAAQSKSSSPTPELRFEMKLMEIADLRREILKAPWPENCRSTASGKELTSSEVATEAVSKNAAISSIEVEQFKGNKTAFLTKSLARFQWVGNFYLFNKLAFRVLVDATDIPQGNAVSAIYVENQNLADAVLPYFKQVATLMNSTPETDGESEKFYVSFLRRLRNPQTNLMSHLEATYGALRAPRYFKLKEVVDGDVNRLATQEFYDASEQSLDDLFPDEVKGDREFSLIWAIAHDGALLIAREDDEQGHPSITGMKPARIAGELSRTSDSWKISSKSGRYSRDYYNANELLGNALKKFKMIFPPSSVPIEIKPFEEEKQSAVSAINPQPQ